MDVYRASYEHVKSSTSNHRTIKRNAIIRLQLFRSRDAASARVHDKRAHTLCTHAVMTRYFPDDDESVPRVRIILRVHA